MNVFFGYSLTIQGSDENSNGLKSVVFPTGFYLVAGYSESMFLTFSLVVILLSRRKK